MQFQDPTSLRGSALVDNTGDKIGTIDEIYLDTQSGSPEWALVNTGLFGTKSTFVPLTEAQRHEDHIHVPFEKAHVKDAPRIEPEGQLTTEEEAALYSHYGLGGRYEAAPTQQAGYDTSGPTTDNAMTRSEEELAVGTRKVETGRARLRKYVVTDTVSETVPVTREELRIEREPITDANAAQALDGPALSEEEHEVVLHAEEPVVEKRVVPKERVALGVERTTEQAQVTEQLAKEEIVLEEGADTTARGGDTQRF